VFQMYVSNALYECCNGSFRMLHMLQWLYTYVVRVCSKCFICFKRILQMFYQNITYVAMAMLQMYVPDVLSECCKSISEYCNSRSGCRWCEEAITQNYNPRRFEAYEALDPFTGLTVLERRQSSVNYT
jgi:hypothetical protein